MFRALGIALVLSGCTGASNSEMDMSSVDMLNSVDMAHEQASDMATTPVPDMAVAHSMVAITAGSLQVDCRAPSFADGGTCSCASYVAVAAFSIDAFETTQREYQSCVAAGTCSVPSFSRDWSPSTLTDLPVVGLSWAQANAYCAYRSKRLPTSQEWERAARGDDCREYPWGSAAPDCTRANSGCHTDPLASQDLVSVGSLPAGDSPDGIHDLIGNATEWTSSSTTDGGAYLIAKGGGYDFRPLTIDGEQDQIGNDSYESMGVRCAK